jgi:eukaryotic-like serine/threonine-protein kinase
VPYMVMELLEGGDLAQTLSQRGRVPVELAADWIVQACEAVAEAHAAGIVHRDLKPQNLFLARTVGGAVNVKVLDFGVAKSVETMASGPGALTRTRAMLGSPMYMAPEQMRSARGVDCRADVWALGVVLFELLTQRMPFESDTLPDLCLKVVSDPPQSLLELRPEVPAAMVKIVERCLEKDVNRRFANAAELASALEPLVPVGSRIVVERARLAMTHLPEATPPPGPLVAAAAVGTPAMSEPVTPAPPRTPTAWGSQGGAPRPSKAARAAVFWIGLGVLALVGIGGAAFVLRHRAADASRVSIAASVSAPIQPPILEIATQPSIAPVSPEPLPSSSPTVSVSAVAAAAPPASPRPVFPGAGRGTAMPAPVPAKQQAPDDDIPTLR